MQVYFFTLWDNEHGATQNKKNKKREDIIHDLAISKLSYENPRINKRKREEKAVVPSSSSTILLLPVKNACQQAKANTVELMSCHGKELHLTVESLLEISDSERELRLLLSFGSPYFNFTICKLSHMWNSTLSLALPLSSRETRAFHSSSSRGQHTASRTELSVIG